MSSAPHAPAATPQRDAPPGGPLRLAYDRGSLLLEGAPQGADPAGGAVPLVWDARVGAHRCHALHYRALVRALTHTGHAFQDVAAAYEPVSLDAGTLPEPYPYQAEALEAWQRGKRGVVELPTGAGKTLLALHAMCAVQRATLVLVPTLDLLAQWSEALRRDLGVEPGVIGGGAHRVEPVTVCTYASALRKGEWLGSRFCLAVFDECHHLAGERYGQAAELLLAPYRLGLSATPESAAGPERMAYLVGPPVYRKGITELSGDFLADYRVETVHAELDEAEAAAYAEARGEYLGFARAKNVLPTSAEGWRRFVYVASRSAEGRRALAAYHRQRRLALAPEAKYALCARLLAQYAGERVLLFTNDNRTAYEVSRRFLIPVITHQTRTPERRTILERFRSGAWPFLVTSRVLNEGVDVPAASVAIVLSGTSSVREHVQRLGRILRRAPGKEAVLYELLTRATGEEFTSQRRRQHDAYR